MFGYSVYNVQAIISKKIDYFLVMYLINSKWQEENNSQSNQIL